MNITDQVHRHVADRRGPAAADSTRSTRPAAILRGAWIALALSLASVAHGQGETIRSGHGGHWYDPARSGEGWVLELLGDDSALLYWFTYDEDGRQRWLTAVGRTQRGDTGDYIDFPTLVVTRGGRFGSGFDPAQVVREAVGSATLRFADCDHGQFSYQAFGQAQTFQVVRLAHTMGTACESANGVPGRESTARAGQSGSWYDPSHNGEGYSLQWMDPRRALITWYSYDTEGRQYWMLGVGELDQAGRLQFPELHATRGARFGAGFDPDDVERFAWGTLTVDIGCDIGTADYASMLAQFGSGGLDLHRLTRLRGVGCPWQRPKLTDIYEISYTPIPLPPRAFWGTPVEAKWLIEDGTLYGARDVMGDNGVEGLRLVRLLPGGSEWWNLPDSDLEVAYPTFVSTDARRVATHRTLYDAGAAPIGKTLKMRTDDGDWTDLAGMQLVWSTASAATRDLSWLAGTGSFVLQGIDSVRLWTWHADAGQNLLPLPVEARMSVGVTTISDDGRIVFGWTFARTAQGLWRSRALRWGDGAMPATLLDRDGHELRYAARASADGRIVFGSGQALTHVGHPNDRQPWYWRGPGDMAYLGDLEDELEPDFVGQKYSIGGVSADGSLAAGGYASGRAPPPTIPILTVESFIWTQRTGLVSLGDLLQELSLPPGEPWTERHATQVSADGRTLLLTGRYLDPQARFYKRAAVLRLHPRSPDW